MVITEIDFNYEPDTKVNRQYLDYLIDMKLYILETNELIKSSKIPCINIVDLKTLEVLS